MSTAVQAHIALSEAFTPKSFERFLTLELDKNLAEISSGENFTQVIFDVVGTAKREGWIERLVGAAKTFNPGNTGLRDLSVSDFYEVSSTVGGKVDRQIIDLAENVTRLDILIRGSGYAQDGLIQTTSKRFEKVDEKLEKVVRQQVEIDSKIERIEIHLNRATVSAGVLDSIYTKVVVGIVIVASLGSLAAGVWQLWMP